MSNNGSTYHNFNCGNDGRVSANSTVNIEDVYYCGAAAGISDPDRFYNITFYKRPTCKSNGYRNRPLSSPLMFIVAMLMFLCMWSAPLH